MRNVRGRKDKYKLDEHALRRCGSGVRRLLSMDEAEIIRAKEKEETRVKTQIEKLKKQIVTLRGKKGKEERVLSDKEFLRLKSRVLGVRDPVYGAVIADKITMIPIKIRAILNFGGNVDDLKAMGIEVHSHVHDVFTITATRSRLAALAAQPATRRIKLPRKCRLDLHDSVPQAEVDQIHALGSEGSGVIVGIIDSGLNVRHHAFRDPATHDTRVLFMWVQDPIAGAPGISPEAHFAPLYGAGLSPFDGLSYGILYDQAAINAAIQHTTPLGAPATYGNGNNQIANNPADPDYHGHGTHVTGIAAGSGLDAAWNPGNNIGAAPLADIVFVATDFDEAHILDATNFIFEIAARQGQPCVINKSLGSHLGPHDGNSDYDRQQDELLYSFKRRSIVRTSGNDNNDEGFRRGVVGAGQSEPFWNVDPNGNDISVVLDVWYTGPELDFKLTCGGLSTGWRNAGDDYNSDTDGKINNYDVYVYRDYETRSNLRNILVWIPHAGIADWRIELRNQGATDVHYWAWVGENADLDGDTKDEMTIGDTGCCKSVITVGGCDKPVGSNPEMIAAYSGRGPTFDGRIKPELTGIGTSVFSANGAADDTYVLMNGTSMAAPLVSGSVAILLEQDPDLNQDAIKALLIQTANRTDLDIDPASPTYDQFERNRYGYGRLRMLTSFQHSLPLRDVDVWVRTADDDYGFEPYPGGCFCHAPEVKILDSGGNETTTLSWGSKHTVRVRIHNLGDSPAVNTKVRLKYTRPWAAPDDWVPCKDSAGNAIEEVKNIPALDYYDLEFSKKWKPDASEVPASGTEWGDHYCLLVELNESTSPDDPLLYDDSAAGGANAWTRNIKGTNNVALRNLHIH